MTTKQIQQIYHYIRANGNYLQTEKVLRQVEKHPDIIWEIICKLCSKFKNKNIDHAFSQMVFTLSDHIKHEHSAKWLKQYMDIRDLSVKLGTPYLIMDYIRPQKDKIINLMSKVVQVSKGVSFIKSQFDEFVVKDDMMSKEYAKFKASQQTTRNALIEITDRKKNERPLYEEKVKLVENIQQQNNQKRQDKLEFFAKQKYFKDEISKEQKKLDQLKYHDQNLLLRIEQIKNQIARNAPEYKKEKIAIEQEYQRLEKQTHFYFDRAKMRQHKVKSLNDQRKKSKTQIYEQVTKLVDVFGLLEQSKSKFAKLKDENQNYKRRKNNLLSLEIDSKQMLKSFEIETQNMKGTKQNLERQKKALDNQYNKISAQLTEVLYRVMQHKQTLRKLKKFCNELKQKVQETKKEYQKEKIFSENEVTKWMTMLNNNLDKMFSPMNEISAALKSKRQFRINYV